MCIINNKLMEEYDYYNQLTKLVYMIGVSFGSIL